MPPDALRLSCLPSHLPRRSQISTSAPHSHIKPHLSRITCSQSLHLWCLCCQVLTALYYLFLLPVHPLVPVSFDLPPVFLSACQHFPTGLVLLIFKLLYESLSTGHHRPVKSLSSTCLPMCLCVCIWVLHSVLHTWTVADCCPGSFELIETWSISMGEGQMLKWPKWIFKTEMASLKWLE